MLDEAYLQMETRSARLGGIVPVNLFPPSSRRFIRGTLSINSVSVPVSLFPVRSSDINLLDMVDGTVPVRRLLFRRSRFRPELNSCGNVPDKILFSRTSMLRLAREEISLGIVPTRLLSTEITKTRNSGGILS